MKITFVVASVLLSLFFTLASAESSDCHKAIEKHLDEKYGVKKLELTEVSGKEKIVCKAKVHMKTDDLIRDTYNFCLKVRETNEGSLEFKDVDEC
jgi:hypothetical protein